MRQTRSNLYVDIYIHIYYYLGNRERVAQDAQSVHCSTSHTTKQVSSINNETYEQSYMYSEHVRTYHQLGRGVRRLDDLDILIDYNVLINVKVVNYYFHVKRYCEERVAVLHTVDIFL